MDNRKFESGASASPPSPPASPSSGYPTNGNPATSTPATLPGEYWFHQVGEELRGVLVAANITPSNADLTQLKQALDALYAPKGMGAPIQPVTASVAANALTVGLNATSLNFRSTTLTTGVPNVRTVGAPLSLVVPSGATLGSVNAQQSTLVLLAIDNAGTVELAICNLAGGLNLDESTLISTTAISAAATSASTIYSQTARSNVPFRVVGEVVSTQATAGTWASAPSLVQGQGGQALAAMQSYGVGQTWQNVTGGRVGGTTYYNTTGRPITVRIATNSSVTGSFSTQPVVGGITIPVDPMYSPSAGSYGMDTFVVPAGASYSVTLNSCTINSWYEMR